MSEEKGNPTTGEIISKYLKSNNFDGLYLCGLCACELSDLMPCDNVEMECTAGYKISGDDLKCDCNFHMSATKNSTDYECKL